MNYLSFILTLVRFAIPFTLSTTLGLAAVALRNDPDMPHLSAADVSAGLPAPAAASALLGKSGAAAMLILLFLAVTSSWQSYFFLLRKAQRLLDQAHALQS